VSFGPAMSCLILNKRCVSVVSYEYIVERFPTVRRSDGEEQLLLPIPHCTACGAPIASSYARTTGTCAFCHRGDPVDGKLFRQIVPATLYIPAVRGYAHSKEIRDFKDDGSHEATFSDLMVLVLREVVPDLRPTSVVPVPSARLKTPGLGVTSVAKHLARHFHVPMRDVLRYVRPVESQKNLKTRAERKGNVQGAMNATEAVPRGLVLLFDDVCTTGFTLQEATRALIANGASSAVAAVIGRDARLIDLARVGVIRPIEG
jgi:predicted amidophosphoribosyltransferase